MSRIRERHYELLKILKEQLRREDDIVRPGEREGLGYQRPEADDDATVRGPEIPDLPLGVPREHDGPPESPGFPRGDPTHG